MVDAKFSSDILDRLACARTSQDMTAIFDAIRYGYCVENLVYHAVNVRGLTKNGAFLRLTYSDEWINRYYEQDYFKIDPVVEEGTRAFMPFNWSDLDWTTKRRREFLEDANGHGVGTNGLTVPIRGPDGQHAIFSLATSKSTGSWNRQMREHLSQLHSIAHSVHEATIRVEGVKTPEVSISLSHRERDVLQLAGAGKTTDEIAHILGISERTVRVYLDTSRHKLNAANRTHAVARALGLGLIHPPD
jgi:DNA-binding CsgD family transcriptional regulator